MSGEVPARDPAFDTQILYDVGRSFPNCADPEDALVMGMFPAIIGVLANISKQSGHPYHELTQRFGRLLLGLPEPESPGTEGRV